MAKVRLSGISKAFGAAPILRDVGLEIADGELVVIVGPSGCGKSTLLRIIAGLERQDGGDVSIDGRIVNDESPAERGVAMVFQSYALYPQMTVYENMAFALTVAKRAKAEIDTAVRQAAQILSIEQLLDRKPKALSGGQRQRVAIGRAIVRKPKVFLFDEPLSNLDAALRVRMRYEFAKLHEELRATMIYVTHDQVEAMTLADRIVVLSQGKIEQIGPPMSLYERPDKLFVAGFIGSPKMNLFSGVLSEVSADGVGVKLASGETIRVAARPGAAKIGESVTLGVRPEHFVLGAASNALGARTKFVERLGGTNFAYARAEAASDDIIVEIAGAAPSMGDALRLGVAPQLAHVFDARGDALPRAQL